MCRFSLIFHIFILWHHPLSLIIGSKDIFIKCFFFVYIKEKATSTKEKPELQLRFVLSINLEKPIGKPPTLSSFLCTTKLYIYFLYHITKNLIKVLWFKTRKEEKKKVFFFFNQTFRIKNDEDNQIQNIKFNFIIYKKKVGKKCIFINRWTDKSS